MYLPHHCERSVVTHAPGSHKLPGRAVQQGFAAITAIFLVVVLAALGGFMLTFSNTQQLTSTQDIQGSRAYWAAHAGLEWGMGSVLRQAAVCPASSTTSTTSTSLPGGTGLFEGGFTVVVTCSRSMLPYDEAGKARVIFWFKSVANNATEPGSVRFIERSLSASVER